MQCIIVIDAIGNDMYKINMDYRGLRWWLQQAENE